MQTGGVKRHANTGTVAGRKKTWYWFTVTSHNNKVLVTSETYKTKQAMEKGIASLINILNDGNERC